jgi:hypothetical protein
MRIGSVVWGTLRAVRGAFLAPTPCAACAGGRAEQDWSLSLGGQVYGFCSHCGSARLSRRPPTTAAAKE